MVSEELLERMTLAASELQPQLIAWRRHLHAHPELSFEEYATQSFVRDQLLLLHLAPRDIAGTGIIVDLTFNGQQPAAKCVAVRADLDALPILEMAGRPYGSLNPGIMHACGHDVHTTCALGAAAILSRVCPQSPTGIRFIFQPGEELLPGGATRVIAEGGLQAPEVAAIIALHVAPDLPVGTLGVKDGAYMASADEIYLTLRGPGGHGALPHLSVDLVAVFAQMIVSLQQVVSRKAPADIPTVLSFGKVNTSGGATNVLPAELTAAGTFRTYDEVWRLRAHAWIREIAEATARMYGAALELKIVVGYPALQNDVAVTSVLRKCFSRLLLDSIQDRLINPREEVRSGFGESTPTETGDFVTLDQTLGHSRDESRHKLDHPSGPRPDRLEELELRPTAEDFAWYLQRVPGSFFRLGVANEAQGITAGVHTATFDVDERCLGIGALALAVAALSLAEQYATLGKTAKI